MKIYSKGSVLLAEVNETPYSGTFMGDRFVTCTVKSPKQIQFLPDDYIDYRGERFILDYTPTDKKIASSGSTGDAFQYELKFVSIANIELKRCLFRNTFLNDNKVHPSSPIVDVFANAQLLSHIILASLNEKYQGENQWNITVLKDVDAKQINVRDISCWDAVALFKTELNLNYIIKGRNITVGTVGKLIDHIFKYGKGNGLIEIVRTAQSSDNLVTKLSAFGGNRNLPKDYKTYAEAPTLMLPDYKTTGKDYIISEEGVKLYGEIPKVFRDEDIYPSVYGATGDDLRAAGIQTTATGRIDEIVYVEPIQSANQASFKAWIKDIGFDINNYLTPVTALLSMRDGSLGGYEFKITKVVKDTSVEGAGYKLTLNRNQDDNFTLPDDKTYIKPGDHFVLLEIYMPEVYVRTAEQRLLNRAKEYLAQNDHVKATYSLNLDRVFMANHPSIGDTIYEGDLIRIVDEDLQLDREIIIQNLAIKNSGPVLEYTITLSDDPVATTLGRVQEDIVDIEKNVTANKVDGIKEARRRAIELQLLRSNIFDPDGEIKDTFLQTMMLQVGANSMNYQMGKTTARPHLVNMSYTNTTINLGTDDVIHFAFGSGEEKASTWHITTSFTGSGLDESKTYFVAIKASRDNLNAEWIVDENTYGVESIPGYYIFNFGILSAVTDGVRFFSETRGNIYAYGDELSAGIISSIDRYSWFNLNTGDFQLYNKKTGAGLQFKDGVLTLGSFDPETGRFSSSISKIENEITQTSKQAADAQKTAKQAVERLTAMSSDGIISKEEKATLRNDKSQIDKEFQKYQQDATQYGVSISNLQAAYTALVDFLVSVVKINEDVDFTFAAGQQATYNQNFANYYAARTSFANEVANKITENGINNIQIGSLNLLNASGPKDGPWVGNSEKYNIAIFTQTANIEIGKTYTLVFEGVNTEGDGMIGFWISGSVLQKSWILPKRQVVSFTFVANTAGFVTFYHRPQGASGTSTIYWAMLVEGNKAPKVWSPSISDQEKEAKLGNLFLRGTGYNRRAERAFVLNSDGVNRAKEGRGLNLIVVLRENLSISENIVYDLYADAIAAQALTDKLNSLGSSVIVTLTSWDTTANGWDDNLSQAIARCGGSGTKPAHREPYAFIGIPGIGKGNGIEITSGAGSNDPYAEVSTKIINGIPSGMTSAASILAAKAKEQAELTTNKLSEWASDNKISPTEKTGLKQQLANIRAEYTEISNSCDRLSLKSTSYWTNYNTAYNAAVAAINKYSAATPEVINIESDYANIAAYYPKRQEISDQITNSDSSDLKRVLIDATKLDVNTYYPVTIRLPSHSKRAEIMIYWDLGGYLPAKPGDPIIRPLPSWSVHQSGYCCYCKWATNGNGWGAIAISRYIESFSFRFTKDDIPPIGSIGQMINSSNEYIYVRGGGAYWVQVKNGDYPSLHSSAFTTIEQTISPISSVIVPVVNVDKAQKDADAASQKAITAQKTADTAGTNALQAQKDANVAVKDAAAALKVAEDAHNDSTAALTEAKNIEFLKAAFGADSTTITGGVVLSSMVGVKNSQNKVVAGLVNGNNPIAKDLMIFAGATSASAMGSAKFRVYSTGKIICSDIEITGGKFMGFNLEQEWLTATRGNNKLFISAGDRSLGASVSYANPCITLSNGNSNLYLGDPLVQGWMIKLNGNMQHYGGTIETSNIECSKFFAANAAFKTIRTTSGLTITDQVYVNIVSSAIPNVYLPSNPPIGRFVFIRISGSRSIYLRTSDGKQIIISNSPVTSNDNWTKAYGLVLLVWDGTYWNFNQMTY